MQQKKITIKQHRKKFDSTMEAAADLFTSIPTYNLWLEGGKPKIKAHRERIEEVGIKKWW